MLYNVQKLFTVQDLLYNNSGNGFFQTKLKNDRTRKRKLETSSNETIENEKIHNETNTSVEFDVEQTKSFETELKIMNTFRLPDEIDSLKEKLKSTLQFRRQKIEKNSINIYTDCNYVFVCPKLVSIYLSDANYESSK